MLMVTSLAMLSACVTDSAVKLLCPAELYQTYEKRPPVPDGAVITGNDLGQAWLGSVVRHADNTDRILDDARAQCKKDLVS